MIIETNVQKLRDPFILVEECVRFSMKMVIKLLKIEDNYDMIYLYKYDDGDM